MAASNLVPVGFRFFKFFLPDFEIKMRIPASFAEQNLSWVKKTNRRQQVTLKSADGTTWEVDLFAQDGDVFMGGEGWRRLVMANKLREGYLLIFRLRSPMSFSFRIYGLNTCEKKKKPTNKTNNRGPTHFFEIGVTRCHLNGSPANISKRFRESSGLLGGEKLELRNEAGEKWDVLVYCRDLPHREIYITKGWRRFVRENRLGVGDRCLFELVRITEKKIFEFKVKKA